MIEPIWYLLYYGDNSVEFVPIEKERITAKIRKLKVKYSIELVEDFMKSET
jgi:hypothetical protein